MTHMSDNEAGQPGKQGRDLTPGETLGFKLGCGFVAVVFTSSMILLIVVLSSGCDEAGDVLKKFREDTRAGKLGPMPMAQADDAEARRVVASSTAQRVSGYESSLGSREGWMCIRSSLSTPQGSKDLDVLLRRQGDGPWVPMGASLARECRIKRGGPRFVGR